MDKRSNGCFNPGSNIHLLINYSQLNNDSQDMSIQPQRLALFGINLSRYCWHKTVRWNCPELGQVLNSMINETQKDKTQKKKKATWKQRQKLKSQNHSTPRKARSCRQLQEPRELYGGQIYLQLDIYISYLQDQKRTIFSVCSCLLQKP